MFNKKYPTYIFDFRDTIGIFKENLGVKLTNEQYEDILYFICEHMNIDVFLTLEEVKNWGHDKNKLSTNFFLMNEQQLAAVRDAMCGLTIGLWNEFNKKKMFDVLATPDLSFPCVLEGVVSSNLIFMKDDVISSNEINIYG